MNKLIAVFSAFCLMGGMAMAEQTTTEKAKEMGRDAKRSMKQLGHRVAEKVCMEDDAECLAEKAKNRAEEAGEYVKDKAKTAKEKID